MGDGEKLLTNLNSALKVTLGLDIFQRVPQKKLNFVVQYYQKAFDSLPHRWIIKSLELFGINNKVIAFTKKAMIYWRTRMRLHAINELIYDMLCYDMIWYDMI